MARARSSRAKAPDWRERLPACLDILIGQAVIAAALVTAAALALALIGGLHG